jgi:Virulence protein
METGHITIHNTESKQPSVEVQLVRNTLWITKSEIARLFNCFIQKIDVNIRSIFKSKLLYEADVTCTHRYTDKNGNERQTTFYNLEMLIFLSYRIGSLEASIFRNFLNESLRENLKGKDNTQNLEIIWISPICYN